VHNRDLREENFWHFYQIWKNRKNPGGMAEKNITKKNTEHLIQSTTLYDAFTPVGKFVNPQSSIFNPQNF
jgi:hypothetical protein